MSADNYIVIFKGEDGKFRGYMGFMSDDLPDEALQSHRPVFEVDTIEAACGEAEAVECEYGYHTYDRDWEEKQADERYRAWRREAWHLDLKLRHLRGNAPADVASVAESLRAETERGGE